MKILRQACEWQVCSPVKEWQRTRILESTEEEMYNISTVVVVAHLSIRIDGGSRCNLPQQERLAAESLSSTFNNLREDTHRSGIIRRNHHSKKNTS